MVTLDVPVHDPGAQKRLGPRGAGGVPFVPLLLEKVSQKTRSKDSIVGTTARSVDALGLNLKGNMVQGSLQTVSGCLGSFLVFLCIFTSPLELGSCPLGQQRGGNTLGSSAGKQRGFKFTSLLPCSPGIHGKEQRLMHMNRLRGGEDDSGEEDEDDEENDKILDKLLEQTAKLRALVKPEEQPRSLHDLKVEVSSGKQYLQDKVMPLFAEAAAEIVNVR
jgi:hypothetical protein